MSWKRSYSDGPLEEPLPEELLPLEPLFPDELFPPELLGRLLEPPEELPELFDGASGSTMPLPSSPLLDAGGFLLEGSVESLE